MFDTPALGVPVISMIFYHRVLWSFLGVGIRAGGRRSPARTGGPAALQKPQLRDSSAKLRTGLPFKALWPSVRLCALSSQLSASPQRDPRPLQPPILPRQRSARGACQSPRPFVKEVAHYRQWSRPPCLLARNPFYKNDLANGSAGLEVHLRKKNSRP